MNLPDPTDTASLIEEQQRELALLQHAARSKVILTGFCQYCGDPTTGETCSPECAEDLMKLRRAEKFRR